MFLIAVACLWACASCQELQAFSLSDSPAITQLTHLGLDVAETPSWDPRNGVLYFTDLFNSKVFSYNYETKELKNITVPGLTALPLILTENSNVIVVGVNSSLIAIEWNGINEPGKQKVLVTVGPQEEMPLLTVYSDGKADKNGNLWIGTVVKNMSSDGFIDLAGSLYRITKENLTIPEVKITDLTFSNGMTWSIADNKFYFTESFTRQIFEYDFDLEAGTISTPQVIFDLHDYPEIGGNPDAIISDNDDNIWITLYGGGLIIRVDPRTRTILQRIALPAKYVSTATWGGPNYDVLFVTTSTRLLNESEKLNSPGAGNIFAITNLPTKGRQTYYTNLVGTL